jgi:putative membrane protein
MEEHLKSGRFTEAVLAAIQKVGGILAQHFPRDPDDRNELPNRIARD